MRAALAGKKFPGRERDETEVRNHFRAVEWMEALADRRGAITEPAIKRLHGLVMHGRNKAFPYRDQQNVIRDSATGAIVYLPPEPQDVPGLMRDLVAWINVSLDRDEWPAPVVAALAHYQFATIHPYMDGNGRAARLLASLIVRREGYGLKGIYSLDEYYAKNLAAYYAALTVGTHNYYDGRAEADITAFVDYFCIGMADAFTKIRAAAAEAHVKAAPDLSAALRDLSPTQRKLLDLFRRRGSATTAEMAAHLHMSPRNLPTSRVNGSRKDFSTICPPPARTARIAWVTVFAGWLNDLSFPISFTPSDRKKALVGSLMRETKKRLGELAELSKL